ncbi:MAG: hypothetical protein QXS81_04995 [Candidatus Micrarchaeaceae archaeon]
MSPKHNLMARFLLSYFQAANNCFGTFWKALFALIFAALFIIIISITMDLLAVFAYMVYPDPILIQQIFSTAILLIQIILIFEIISIVFGLLFAHIDKIATQKTKTQKAKHTKENVLLLKLVSYLTISMILVGVLYINLWLSLPFFVQLLLFVVFVFDAVVAMILGIKFRAIK